MQPPATIAGDDSAGASSALRPIGAAERIELIDALRGFALLGILLVNMYWFAQPLATEFADLPRELATHDRFATMAVEFLAEGKFYSIFSMLFGFGMAIQLSRAEQRGGSFAAVYVRRLLALLLIAAAHITLLWFGDILHAYALLGFVLLLFCKRRPMTLLIWAGVFLVVPILLFTSVTLLALLARAGEPSGFSASRPADAQMVAADSMPTDSRPAEADADELTLDARELLSREMDAYRGSSFGSIVRQRLEDFSISSLLMITVYPVILAMFLCGLWLAQSGILHHPEQHRRWLLYAGTVGFTLGFPLNGMQVWLTSFAREDGFEWLWLVQIPVGLVAGPTLALGYVCSLALSWQTRAGRKILGLLAPAGRMALSNYLFQSLVCTTLFYGYGFGMFGESGALARVGIALAIYAVQVALSQLWLRRFRFGPAEWLWRSMTYGRIQPLAGG